MSSNGFSDLAAEGVRIGRYLLGVDPPGHLVARYEQANAVLFGDTTGREDRALLRFVSRHPWSLPALESALGLIRPDALLRRKIVVMMAVLETSPEFVPCFEPRAVGALGTVVRLLGHGITSAIKIKIGLVLYCIARIRA